MNNNKHRFYLTQILTDIYSDRELAHCLGFKGGCLKRTRMTRITRIFTDNIINKNCIYLIINNIKISAYPRYLRHPRSKILLRQPQFTPIFGRFGL